jgi:Zn-dependent M28 family amino/carboxypeptidase
MNQGNGDPVANADRYELFEGTLGGPVGMPAVSVSTIRSTSNVLTQSTSGRTDNVVMAGAHLDSEPDTTGINDNGSESVALLEVAVEMAKLETPNAVRFAWWGAEEASLQGSTFHVNSLSDAELATIALYLNFDMIASPNYTFGVYDGDDSAGEGVGPGPAGSAAIEQVFLKFFAARGEATKASDFTGRSDYGPSSRPGSRPGGCSPVPRTSRARPTSPCGRTGRVADGHLLSRPLRQPHPRTGQRPARSA